MKAELDPLIITPEIGKSLSIFYRQTEESTFKVHGKVRRTKTGAGEVTVSGFKIPSDVGHRLKIKQNSTFEIQKVFQKTHTIVTIKVKSKKTTPEKIWREINRFSENIKSKASLCYLKKKIKRFCRKNPKSLSSHFFDLLVSLCSTAASLPLRLLMPIHVPIYNPERLGHAVGNTDTNLMEIAAGLHGPPQQPILLNFYQHSSVQDVGRVFYGKVPYAKEFLGRLQIRGYKVYPGWFFQKVIERAVRKSGCKIFINRRFAHRDIFNAKRYFRATLEVKPEELISFFGLMKRKGLSVKKPLVVFACRETGQIPGTTSKKITDDSRYGYRNTEQKTLVATIHWLLKKEFVCVRVGRSSTSFPCEDKNFYDYASDPQAHSFTHDLLFFRQCCFYIGDTSGVYVLAELFRKPVLFYNYAPLVHFNSWSENYMAIFKHPVCKDGKAASFSLQISQHRFHEIHGEKFAKQYRYQSNTTREILGGTRDMVKHVLQGRPLPAAHISRMRELRGLFGQTDIHLVQAAQISPSFLARQA